MGNPHAVGQNPLRLPLSIGTAFYRRRMGGTSIPPGITAAFRQMFWNALKCAIRNLPEPVPTNSQGLKVGIRRHVAQYIADRDGHPPLKEIFSHGQRQRPGIEMVLNALIAHDTDMYYDSIPRYPSIRRSLRAWWTGGYRWTSAVGVFLEKSWRSAWR
jgi:hypothetical protein